MKGDLKTMKKYQAPQIEVVKFEVEDVITGSLFGSKFDSFNLGEWSKNDTSSANWV